MRTPDCIYNFITAPLNRFGIYTRRNCVDKATQIGKELVDIGKTQTLTKQEVEAVVKKHAKGISLPNIVTTREEAIELSMKNGIQRSVAEAKFDSMPIGYFAFMSNDFRGIFFSVGNWTKCRADIIPHELEHYFFVNGFFKNIWSRFKYKKLGRGRISEREELIRTKSEPYMLPKLLQPKLSEHFGTNPGQLDDFIKEYAADEKGFMELLASNKFSGLRNQKRLDAQLRAFLRSFCNPKNGKVNVLKGLRGTLEEESNAYTVSDRVLRYEAGTDCLTRIGVRKYIYRRAVELLNEEIKIAQQAQKAAKKSGIPLKKIKTGMPSDCFIKSKN